MHFRRVCAALAVLAVLTALPSSVVQASELVHCQLRTLSGSPCDISAQASVSPATASAGQTVSVHLELTALTASSLATDLAVIDASQRQVWNAQWAQQAFSAGQSRSYDATWSIPSGQATGAYSVKAQIYQDGTLLTTIGSLASFGINAAPTSTPTVVATSSPTSPATPTPSATFTPSATSTPAAGTAVSYTHLTLPTILRV